MELINTLLNYLGWLGAFIILYAFYLNNYKKIINKMTYFYNIIGGVFLLLASASKFAYFNVALNLIWVLIASISLYSLSRKK
jgi:hypothetical protein